MPKIAAGATNKNISIAPHGTGKVVVGTGAADATLQSDGDFNLVLKTGNSTTGKIEIVDGANGNIDITPNGTGEVDIPKVDIDGGAVDGITLGTNSAVTEAQIDNINIDGNAITSTDTNGNIDLTPAGTGEVNISKVDIDGGAIDATDVTVGSGKTLDVSAGTLTSSTAQKQAIVDGASIEGTDILSTGETGKFLGADGDDSSSWQTIGGTLPSQTGNAEKILKTNGSAASWTATRKLIASTDGIQRSDATAVLSEDGSNVATLDNVTLGSSAVFPAGHVLQVQQTVLTAVDSVNSTTYEVMLSRSITPLDVNSHFLIMFSGQISSSVGSPVVAITGTSSATDVTIVSPIGDVLSTRSRSTWGGHMSSTEVNPYVGNQSAITYLHDPALSDLSTIYYNVSMADVNTNTVQLIYINRAFTPDNNSYVVSTASTLTVMEIAQSS